MENEPIDLSWGSRALVITCVEYGTEPGMATGDLRLSVSATQDDFSGRYDQVWISKQSWVDFMRGLRLLERARSGKTTLEAISPDEFQLTFEIVGHVGGRVVAYGYLARYHFGGVGPTTASRVYYEVGVDPSMFRNIVEKFEEMGQPHE